MTINEQQNHFRLSFCPGTIFLPACNEARGSFLQPVTASDAHIPDHCWTQGQTDILAAGFFVRSCRNRSLFSCRIICSSEGPEDDHVICFDLPDFAVSLPEEFFFRGFLQDSIGKSFRAVFLVSLLFSLAHLPKVIFMGEWISLLSFFPFIDYGWLYMKTNNILPGVIFHFLANLVYQN